MNGNVGEWTEGRSFSSYAIVRNGEYVYPAANLHADHRRIRTLTRESGDIGFRVSEVVPEPATMGLLALGGLALLKRRS